MQEWQRSDLFLSDVLENSFSLTDSRWWKLWFSSKLCTPGIAEDRSQNSYWSTWPRKNWPFRLSCIFSHIPRPVQVLFLFHLFLLSSIGGRVDPVIVDQALISWLDVAGQYVVLGGPPCQGFSICGSRDIQDKRNDLLLETIRFIEGLKPKVFLIDRIFWLLVGVSKVFADEYEQSEIREEKEIKRGKEK